MIPVAMWSMVSVPRINEDGTREWVTQVPLPVYL